MKETKRKYYFSKILECLIEEDKTTIEEISEKVKISEKTVRTKIKEISEYLEMENLGKITKKPRVGIWLECDDAQLSKLKQLTYNSESIETIQDNDDRLYDVLRYLFKYRSREIITTNKIAQSLYLSNPTVLKIIKECEVWLKQYDIELQNTRNKGIIIIFNENNYRRAVQKVILHGNGAKNIDRNIMDILPTVRTDLIRKAILDTEQEWKFEFVDESFYEILVYCCVAVSRGNKGTISIDIRDIPTIEHYNEFQFAKSIYSHLSAIYNIEFSENEIYLLAIQIICAKYLEDNKNESYEDAIRENESSINKFTDELILQVSNIIGIDLNGDEILKSSLVLHLQSTIFRMKYSNLTTNSLIYYIKKQYKKLFRATWSLSILFEKYFGFKITEDELGFICLYFQAAIERKENRLNILIVTNQSRSTSQLFIQRIRNTIQSVDVIKVISEHDIKDTVYNDYDVIISQKDLKIKNKPVLIINDILQDKWMNELISIISSKQLQNFDADELFDPIVQKLFDPEILLVNKEFNDKDEVLEVLSNMLLKKGYVTDKFIDSVKEREKITSTEIGNGIALPHGEQKFVNYPKVAIALLSKPIIWNGDEVDVVFLLAIKMMTPEEIKQAQLFYKQFIELIDTEEKLKKLKLNKSEIELYQSLIR